MKSKWFLRVLATSGILALAATPAQAGSGGTPSALSGFFVCHGISGDAAGTVVEVQPTVFGAPLAKVTIGNGTLACAFAKLFRGGQEIQPNPNPGSELKCYNVSVSRKDSSPGTPSSYGAIDSFGSESGIQAQTGIRYICGPAGFTLE